MARIKTAASIRSNSFPAIKLLTAIKVAVGAASAASAAMAPNITCIRLCSDVDCHIEIAAGAGVAATAASTFLPAKRAEYFNCAPGDVVTVIQDVGGGQLYITPAAIG